MPKQTIKNTASIFCLLLIAAPMIATCIHYWGLYFLLYFIFWIILPGYLFLYAFKNNELECKNFKLSFLYAFFLGVISLFIQFFILHLLNFIELIKYINPVFSLITVILFYIHYKKTAKKAINIKQNINILGDELPFILVVLFATYLLAFTLNFYIPAAETIKFPDYTWHIGNVAQLSSDNPFEDIRVAGAQFNYHYFNTLFYAIEKIIFNIPAWIIFTQHQIFIIPILISTAIYHMYSKISNNKGGTALFTVFTFTGFTISSSYGDFMYQWSSNINAVAMATTTICTMFFAIQPLLQEHTSLSKKIFSLIILFVLLLLFASGIKGPYGAIAILAIICFIIMQLLRRKQPTTSLLLLLAGSIISFIPIYLSLLSHGGGSYFGNNFFEGILASVTRVPLFSELRDIPYSRVFLFIPSLIFTLTLTFIPLILCTIDCILYACRKKELKPEFVFAAFMTIIGGVAYYTFSLNGIGQVYFLFCAIPFVGYLTLSKMVELFKTRPNLRKTSVALVLCFSVICFYRNIYFKGITLSLSEVKNYFTATPVSLDVTKIQEFDAYEFLKTNVLDERLTISNRQRPDDTKSKVYHYISAFSEKNCYLEGYYYAESNIGFTNGEEQQKLVESFFSNNLTSAEKYSFAINENIGYVFIFAENEYETTHPETGNLFKEIFSNDAVTIYEVLV